MTGEVPEWTIEATGDVFYGQGMANWKRCTPDKLEKETEAGQTGIVFQISLLAAKGNDKTHPLLVQKTRSEDPTSRAEPAKQPVIRTSLTLSLDTAPTTQRAFLLLAARFGRRQRPGCQREDGHHGPHPLVCAGVHRNLVFEGGQVILKVLCEERNGQPTTEGLLSSALSLWLLSRTASSLLSSSSGLSDLLLRTKRVGEATSSRRRNWGVVLVNEYISAFVIRLGYSWIISDYPVPLTNKPAGIG